MNCIEFDSRDLGVPSFTLTLIVQLYSKLLDTVRDTSADCNWSQGWRLRVASGATAPGPTLEGALRFRPMSLSSYILR